MNYTIKPTLSKTQYYVALISSVIGLFSFMSMMMGEVGIPMAFAIGVVSGLFVIMNEALIRVFLEWLDGTVTEKVFGRPAFITMTIRQNKAGDPLIWAARQRGVEIGNGVLESSLSSEEAEEQAISALYKDVLDNISGEK